VTGSDASGSRQGSVKVMACLDNGSGAFQAIYRDKEFFDAPLKLLAGR
jgi:hypothetical protein